MWSVSGYTGTGNVNKLIGSLEGRTAIVAGNADGVWKEFGGLLEAVPDPVVFAVNDVGMYMEPLHHWVSIHLDKFPAWIAVRKNSLESSPSVHSVSYGDGVNYAWEALDPVFILSGYFAMQLAYLMGAAKIILCGCPGEKGRRFFDLEARDFGYGAGSGAEDKLVQGQVISEMVRLPEFKSRVRSTSGWTKEFFSGIDTP